MRKIKFRGTHYSGGYLYGDLIHQNGRTYINDVCGEFLVKPESVVQLVCEDIHGNEIYENDPVIDVMGICRHWELRPDFVINRNDSIAIE